MNFGSLTAESGWRVSGTQQISTGFAYWLRYCTNAAQRRSTKLCTMFGRLPGGYTIYTFLGVLALTEFCQVQNSFCVQVLRFPILAALLHCTREIGVIQTLRRGTRNWITQLSLLVIFNRGRHLYSAGAAITLSIGPHSSVRIFSFCTLTAVNVVKLVRSSQVYRSEQPPLFATHSLWQRRRAFRLRQPRLVRRWCKGRLWSWTPPVNWNVPVYCSKDAQFMHWKKGQVKVLPTLRHVFP